MELFAVISGAWAVGTPFRAGERVCCSPVTPNIIGEPALLRYPSPLSSYALFGSEAEPPPEPRGGEPLRATAGSF